LLANSDALNSSCTIRDWKSDEKSALVTSARHIASSQCHPARH
jgi:hypothetical protein